MFSGINNRVIYNMFAFVHDPLEWLATRASVYVGENGWNLICLSGGAVLKLTRCLIAQLNPTRTERICTARGLTWY